MDNNKNIGGNSTGKNGYDSPSDPIARNDKDIDKSQNQIQEIKVSRCENVPALATNTIFVPNRFSGANQNSQPAPSATELLVSILRFKWTIIAIFIIVSAPLIAVVWTQIVPQYQARAEVRVRPIIPRLVFRTEDNGMIPLYDSFVNTQVSIMRSLTVLQRVLDQQQVQETDWYKNQKQTLFERLRGNPPLPIERLRDGFSVRPRPRTEIIDVSFNDTKAADAKIIVNAVLEQYIKYIGEKSDATEDQLYRQLTDQYNSLEQEIKGREAVCAEFRRALGTGIPEELIASKRVYLDQTKVRLNELQQSIAVTQWECKKLEELIQKAESGDANSLPALSTIGMERIPKYFYEDPEWRMLDTNVKTLRHQIETSILSSSNPDMIKARKDLEFAKELLQTRQEQLQEQWQDMQRNMEGLPMSDAGIGSYDYRKELNNLNYKLERSKHEEQLLLAEYKKQQGEFSTLFESAQSLERENTALQHKRELFEAVRERLDQKNIERNVPGQIEVLMQAYSPSKSSGDRRMVFTAMVLCMCLGMGGGVAFLRASRNQAVYAAKDIPHPANAPFLGYVPLIRTKKSPGKSLREEIEKKQFLLVESIRVLRTSLLSRLNGRTGTTILITSAMAGTGKSSITDVLGKSLAQAGKKILIIDVDFHKMTLSKWFGLHDRYGFMDSLRCKVVQKRHIYPTETAGLSFMPSGRLGKDHIAAEEIANGAFRACMNQLSGQYNFDIILLDCSPVLPVADATILASQVDGTIMVERENISHRLNIFNALTRLDSGGGNLLGTVFIGSGGRGDYGYKYRYGETGKS